MLLSMVTNLEEDSSLHGIGDGFVCMCMGTKIAFALLLSALSFAADQEKIFSLANAQTVKQISEIATVVRSTTQDRTLFVDADRKTMTVRGSEQQIAITDWLLKQLDHSPSEVPPAAEYKAGDTDFVQVRHLPGSMALRPIQELITGIRSTIQFKVMFVAMETNPPAVVMRGTRGELAMAQWMFRGLIDNPSPGEFADEGNEFVRLFYPKTFQTTQNLQELVTLVRTVVEARRMFTYNPSFVLMMHGGRADMNHTQWLINELDKPAPLSSPNPEFRSSNDDITRVFGLKKPTTVPELYQLAVAVRSATGATRLFAINSKNAMVVRGTPAQIRKAQTMLEDK